MDTATVTDIYQASYYLLSGCEVTGIECNPSGSKNLVCTLYFQGINLVSLKDSWFSKRAMVNLASFRTAYGQVHEIIDQAKKEYARVQGGQV